MAEFTLDRNKRGAKRAQKKHGSNVKMAETSPKIVPEQATIKQKGYEMTQNTADNKVEMVEIKATVATDASEMADSRQVMHYMAGNLHKEVTEKQIYNHMRAKGSEISTNTAHIWYRDTMKFIKIVVDNGGTIQVPKSFCEKWAIDVTKVADK